MRLFIAVNLTARDRKKIHSAVRDLRNSDYPVRWTEPDAYHLTLKFLGTVDPRQVEEVNALVEGVAAQTRPFDLNIKGIGAFPTIRLPQTLWVGVDPSPALRCLKQDLEWAMSRGGYERETRAFHPHITIGRADSSAGAGAFRGLDEASANFKFKVTAPLRSVDLMRSHLSKDGARYEALHKSSLATG